MYSKSNTMNKFSEFNKNFFKSKEIEWFDTEGTMKLDDNRVVVISIGDLGTRDHYNGYLVEIYNKHQGLIVKKWFKFKDYLEFTHRDKTSKYFHVWLNDDNFEWYISRPKDTKVMVKTIFDFIEKFR